MPIAQTFVSALIAAITSNGWQMVSSANGLPNPFAVHCTKNGVDVRVLIHARPLTLQAREGNNPSSHNRPVGELHTQMIFDGDIRGAGQINHLRFIEDYKTLLLGFYQIAYELVVAAYDPLRHKEYAYSKSLQVKLNSLERAVTQGMTIQMRTTGEVIVIFPISEIAEYVEFAEDFHAISPSIVGAAEQEVEAPPVIKTAVSETALELPILIPNERKRIIRETGRYLRDKRFEEGIKQIYDRCAICNFQYDYIIDAAHIVPVAEGGTDTYENGLGLCPNCHRMYDKGLILVDGQGKIYLNSRYAEEYDQIGRAGIVHTLLASLREVIWMPDEPSHRPAEHNLQRTFMQRR